MPVSHTHDGHHTELVHRHVEAHQPISAETRFDHDEDEEVAWLDHASFVSPRPIQPQQPLIELPNERLEPARLERPREWAIRTVRMSVHAPPWIPATGLRAPPASLV